MRFALESAQQWLQNLSQKVRHDRVSKNDSENLFEIIWLYHATFEFTHLRKLIIFAFTFPSIYLIQDLHGLSLIVSSNLTLKFYYLTYILTINHD